MQNDLFTDEIIKELLLDEQSKTCLNLLARKEPVKFYDKNTGV